MHPRHTLVAPQRIILSLVLATCLLTVRPLDAGAGSWTVTALVDELDGSCGDGDCSLRDAVALAAPGDTITFGVTGTLTLTRGYIDIDKGLTISGPGADALTVSGNHAGSVFVVSADYTSVVNISGLTVADGADESSTSVSGAGIYNDRLLGGGSRLTVSRCRFIGNETQGSGGAIYSSGTLTVTQCTFDGNSAVDGGAIASYFRTTRVLNSTFRHNVSTDDGGAIDASHEGNIDISGSSFIDNESETGGSVYVGLDTHGTIVGSVFRGNRAMWGGGLAVYGIVAADRASFSDNVAYAAVYNNGEGLGGAIYGEGLGSLTVTNSSVYSNTAQAGGGIYFERDHVATIANCTIAANLAPLNGNNVSSRGALTVTNTIVADAASSAMTQPDSCQGSLSAASSHNLTTNHWTFDQAPSFARVDATALGLIWQGGVLRIGEGSAAIDAGDDTHCPAIDQLGWHRPYDGDGDGTPVSDIGAHEFVPGLRALYIPAIVR